MDRTTASFDVKACGGHRKRRVAIEMRLFLAHQKKNLQLEPETHPLGTCDINTSKANPNSEHLQMRHGLTGPLLAQWPALHHPLLLVIGACLLTHLLGGLS